VSRAVAGPAHQRQHHDDQAQIRAEDGRDDQDDQKLGDDEHPLGEAHQGALDAPAPVACRRAHRHTDQHRAGGGEEAHHQRHARAVEHAAQDVAAEIVRAQPMPAPRWP
jgi:hypothetical protein